MPHLVSDTRAKTAKRDEYGRARTSADPQQAVCGMAGQIKAECEFGGIAGNGIAANIARSR